MSTISSTPSVAQGTSIFSARTTPIKKAADPGELGKDDFMKLMLAQLQHQDPLKPMDDQAFITQVAQFQTLDQMSAMNKAVTALLATQQLAEASAMIGRTITGLSASGDEVVGTVTAATIQGEAPLVYVGSTPVKLENVTSVAIDPDALGSVGVPA